MVCRAEGTSDQKVKKKQPLFCTLLETFLTVTHFGLLYLGIWSGPVQNMYM